LPKNLYNVFFCQVYLRENIGIIMYSSYGAETCKNVMHDMGPDLFDSTSNMPLNTWFHLANVLGGNTGRIYFNGNLTAEGTSMSPRGFGVKTNCEIGGGYMVPSNVAIDELKFHERALSPAEILADYHLNGPIIQLIIYFIIFLLKLASFIKIKLFSLINLF
jgi:hypothetical protein